MPMNRSEGRNQCPHCGYWHLADETCNCLREVEAGAKALADQSALRGQVSGTHYKDMVIQPADFTTRNGIGHLAGDAIAYISRYRAKNGKEDLQKAIHSIQLLIELEYG